jgi:uncharacterized protein (DUF427 family)
VGEKKLDNVLSFSSDLSGPAKDLAGLVKVNFDSADQWFEEDTPIFVHPKDPFKRIEILTSTRRIRVFIDDHVVADTRTSQHLYETGLPVRHYMPLTAVDQKVLRKSKTRTKCPYKGEAEYYSVDLGKGNVHEDVVWYYDTPILESASIVGLVCFYNENVSVDRCRWRLLCVGHLRVRVRVLTVSD